jgi:hypothetical protein
MISVPRLLAGAWGETHSIQQLFAVSPPFTRQLREQVGITPGSRFRGYADYLVPDRRVPMTVPLEILSWNARDIPTLSQYTYFLNPAYHAFVTRLLDDPDDRPNINHIAISRPDVRLLRMLGLGYLMARSAFDLPQLTRVDRQGPYYLYEIADPNLGSFSPTRVQIVPDARGALATLANPALDPRVDAVTTEEIGANDLVPATATSLTFVRGGIQFTGRSTGRSLVVLPVQFTHCLELRPLRAGSADARAFRVNLVETGLLFTGDVELEGRTRFSSPWEPCLGDDVADIDRLRLRDLVERRRLPDYTFPGWRLRLFAPFGLD